MVVTVDPKKAAHYNINANIIIFNISNITINILLLLLLLLLLIYPFINMKGFDPASCSVCKRR